MRYSSALVVVSLLAGCSSQTPAPVPDLGGAVERCLSLSSLVSGQVKSLCRKLANPSDRAAMEAVEPAVAQAYSAACRRAALVPELSRLLPELLSKDRDNVTREKLRRLCADDHEIGEVYSLLASHEVAGEDCQSLRESLSEVAIDCDRERNEAVLADLSDWH